jgi:hypothetical protein
VVVSYLLSPILNMVVAPLAQVVGGIFPQAAYMVGPLVNLAAAAVLAVVFKGMVAKVALGMAIYSMLTILAPLLTVAGQAVGGLVQSITPRQ